jgi:hypothetical protein
MNQSVKTLAAMLCGAAIATSFTALSEHPGEADPRMCTAKVRDLQFEVDQRFDQLDQKLIAQAGAIGSSGSRVDSSDNSIRSQLSSIQVMVAALPRR